MNTTTVIINRAADAADLLTARAANHDARNTPTDAPQTTTRGTRPPTRRKPRRAEHAHRRAEHAHRRAANHAAMNAPTDQQKADFTENVGDIDTTADPLTLGGNSARLVDDEWHETNHTTNGSAADTYEHATETTPNDIDSSAQHRGETWDGADPKEGRPLPAHLLHEERHRHRPQHVPGGSTAHGTAPRRQITSRA